MTLNWCQLTTDLKISVIAPRIETVIISIITEANKLDLFWREIASQTWIYMLSVKDQNLTVRDVFLWSACSISFSSPIFSGNLVEIDSSLPFLHKCKNMIREKITVLLSTIFGEEANVLPVCSCSVFKLRLNDSFAFSVFSFSSRMEGSDDINLDMMIKMKAITHHFTTYGISKNIRRLLEIFREANLF